jgi:hypothetical protein
MPITFRGLIFTVSWARHHDDQVGEVWTAMGPQGRGGWVDRAAKVKARLVKRHLDWGLYTRVMHGVQAQFVDTVGGSREGVRMAEVAGRYTKTLSAAYEGA